jgi:hypothetical protein
MKKVTFFILFIVIYGSNATAKTDFINEEKSKVCKAYIGSIMKRPISIMTHYKSDNNGYVYVKYEGKWFNGEDVTFKYVCDINSSTIEYSHWLIEDKSMGMRGNKWSDWKEKLKVKYNYNKENKVLSFISPKTSEEIKINL